MKFLLNSTLTALVATTPVFAQSSIGFESAQISLAYEIYDDGEGFDVSWVTGLGRADFSLSEQFGFQVGAGFLSDVASSDPGLEFQNIRSFDLHGYYDVSAEMRVGVMAGFDTYDEGYYVYGIEAIYAQGPIRIEGRYAMYNSDFDSPTLFELKGAYDISNGLSLTGAYQILNYSDGNGHYSLMSVGAEYDVTERIAIYGSYGWNENDFGGGEVYNGSNISVGVRLSIGGSKADKLFTYNPYF